MARCDHGGIALIAALILIAIVGILAAAVLQSTSTEVAISGQHKRALEGLYAAEAGLAEAKARLWKHPGAETYYLSDPQSEYSVHWSAYLIATPNWEFQNDPTYASYETHYVPIAENPGNTLARFNSAQSLLSYWVKVQHKTERDAEQDGHHPSHPHYVDADGIYTRHQGIHKGNILYFGYPFPQGDRPVQFTTSGRTPYLPVERVTAHSAGTAQGTRIQVDAIHYPGLPQLAALYSQNGVALSGGQGTFNGHDACGFGPSRAPIVSGAVMQSRGSFQFGGTPPAPQVLTLNLDLTRQVSSLQGNALVLMKDKGAHQEWGAPSLPVTMFAQAEEFSQPEGLELEQVTGYGILAVNGQMRIQGPVSWVGLLIVSGRLIFDAPGSTVSIRGGVWAGEVEARGGIVQVQYDSCAIKSSLLARPVSFLNWKERY